VTRSAPSNYSTFDIVEDTAPVRAPTTTLYDLAPIKTDKSMREGSRSHLLRLAEAHTLTPRQLVQKVFIPQLEKHNVLTQSLFYKSESRSINGVSQNAINIARETNTLTGRTDIAYHTMLPWLGIMNRDGRGLLKHNRAWCPLCFQHQAMTTGILYEPLVWSISTYHYCHIHNTVLADTCHNCHKHQPFLPSQTHIGNCNWCGANLLDEVSHSIETLAIDEDDRTTRELLTRYTLELVAQNRHPVSIKSTANLIIGLKQVIDMYKMLGGGGHNFYTKYFGVKRDTLFQWKRGRNVPRFDLLLLFCARVQISPLKLINSSTTSFDIANSSSSINVATAFDIYKTRNILKSILSYSDTHRISLVHLSRILGIDSKKLRTMFPGKIPKLGHHRRKTKFNLLATIPGRHKSITAAVRQLHSKKSKITPEAIERFLGFPGLIACPKYYSTYIKALKELRTTLDTMAFIKPSFVSIDYDWLEQNYMTEQDLTGSELEI